MLLLSIVGCNKMADPDSQLVDQKEPPSGILDRDRDMDSISEDIEQQVKDGELTQDEADELLKQLKEGGGPGRQNKMPSEEQNVEQ
jgi:ornithine cyclodeaminase/alanine dehydrogenase-like protein (mu-crystallin family)